MKGHPRIIGYLQRAVNHEFGAAQQYTLQAGAAESWGMRDLADKLRCDAREELEHAEAFIVQMLRLGSAPHTGLPRVPQIGSTHAELLQFGLRTEMDAVSLYRAASRFCEQIGDKEHYELFERILKDEEHHTQELQRLLQALGE